MNHKSRMLAAFRGEQVDRLPYVPRLDLWYLANHTCGTLPAQHAGRTMNSANKSGSTDDDGGHKSNED